MLKEVGDGRFYTVDERNPHLGGNIWGGDIRTYTPRLWQWLLTMFRVNSVLDVGCGEGIALSWFRGEGCSVIGVEGLMENVKKCAVPVICWDITKGALVVSNVDLVWCCEVVEHIEEEYVSNLLETIAVGRVLAMTYAGTSDEDKDGWHHVNCQPQEYWEMKLWEYGYVLDTLETYTARSKVDKDTFFGRTGLIFKRKEEV